MALTVQQQTPNKVPLVPQIDAVPRLACGCDKNNYLQDWLTT